MRWMTLFYKFAHLRRTYLIWPERMTLKKSMYISRPGLDRFSAPGKLRIFLDLLGRVFNIEKILFLVFLRWFYLLAAVKMPRFGVLFLLVVFLLCHWRASDAIWKILLHSAINSAEIDLVVPVLHNYSAVRFYSSGEELGFYGRKRIFWDLFSGQRNISWIKSIRSFLWNAYSKRL